MSRNQVEATLVIHVCPLAIVDEVSQFLGGADISWHSQPLQLGTVKTEFSFRGSELQAEDMVSGLNRFGSLALDLMVQGKERGVWFMLAPVLGVFRAETNQAGEILISEERIRNALDLSAGNHRELSRMLRLAIGQAWDDILEPYRAARYQANLGLINRAV
ncbi:MAG: DUF3145 family protein [Acidobacteria bacterium]|nr:DUF3145 family protein [Acidobacteriota bacterium]